jgi:hypothetical protein
MPLAFLLAAVLASGCGTDAPAPVVATIDVAPATVSVSRPVEVSVSIVNASDEDVDVVDPRAVCGTHLFRLYDANDREIALPPRPEYCTLELVGPLRLHAGETVTASYSWTPAIGTGDASGNLPPGDYLLRARLYSMSGELPSAVVALRIVTAE